MVLQSVLGPCSYDGLRPAGCGPAHQASHTGQLLLGQAVLLPQLLCQVVGGKRRRALLPQLLLCVFLMWFSSTVRAPLGFLLCLLCELFDLAGVRSDAESFSWFGQLTPAQQEPSLTAAQQPLAGS
jgi:hypothetical protein